MHKVHIVFSHYCCTQWLCVIFMFVLVQVGDVVDALFTLYGAWFEGKIAQIQAAGNAFLSSNDPVLNTLNSDRLMYKVSFDW